MVERWVVAKAASWVVLLVASLDVKWAVLSVAAMVEYSVEHSAVFVANGVYGWC